MSSHHIIRDEQEPALLVLDPLAIEREHLNGLLEWSPTLLVTEQNVNTLLDWGIKVDRVLARSGSPLLKTKQELFDVIELPGGNSALDEGLAFLLRKNHHSVNIVGNPENVPVFIHPLVRDMNCVLFEANQKIVLARNGIYRKWFKAYTALSIQPLGLMYLSTDGLMDNIDNEKVEDELQITSADDGILSLRSNLKPFLVSEAL
jgi:thiamine pyrophosphokinase